MKKFNIFLLAFVICIFSIFSTGCLRKSEPETVSQAKQEMSEQEAKVQAKQVKLQTTMGDIVIELDWDKAPVTCANFQRYVEEGFYEGTIFHRVIAGFMIQGGGMTADMAEKKNNAPIVNEASNGLSNARGTISMARTPDPDSATSQFFINLVDNRRLDYSPGNAGYAVFGKVTEGMEVVDEIAKVKTTTKPPHADVPAEPITITSATAVE